MSRDLLRLFLAQKSAKDSRNKSPLLITLITFSFNYFLEVAVIVIVMRLVGTSFLCPGLLS